MNQSGMQNNFDSKFYKLQKNSLGIYGTGKNARTILENVKGYSFTCLIAPDHLHETVNGVTVLPLEEALKKVEAILIAAIPSSTAIVYDRIKDKVPEDIPIYDLQGYLLRGDDNYKNNPYWDSDKSDLKKLIDSHDVISFDVFDTLITRTTLYPRDIFDRMNVESGFRDERIYAEEELYKDCESPTLTQIYDRISSDKAWASDKTETIQRVEISTEKSSLVIRRAIYELFKYAVDSGKEVFLTSDMYLERADLLNMLESLGISDGFKLIVSCEYAKTKETGELYDILLEKNPGKSVLHIGDNLDTDIERAKSKGIDTYYVKKGFDILAESSCAYLFDLARTNDDKALLGYMVSEVLNDPFCLSETKGKLNIEKFDHIAACILPITVLYLKNISQWAREYDEILFASRDGFFLYELYEWYRKENPYLELPESKYIYVSRSAISSMAVKATEDIEVFLNKIVDDPKLNLKRLVENQFQISLSDEFDLSTGEAVDKWGIDEIKAMLSQYYNMILDKASMLRCRYQDYLKKIGIKTSGKIAVVDVVTQGTLVYGLSNIFENEIDLFAMGTSAVPNKYIKNLSGVHSIYGNITERVGDSLYSMSDFAELHLFLEMLYASKDGQFYSIDEDLNPVFVAGSEYDSNLLKGVQGALKRMIKKFVSAGSLSEVSPEFALGMLRIFSKKYSAFSDEIKAGFSFEDPYDGSIQKCNLIDFIQ